MWKAFQDVWNHKKLWFARIVSISTLHLTLPIDLEMSKQRSIRNINIIPSTSWLVLESASFDIPLYFLFSSSYSQINRDKENSPIFLMRSPQEKWFDGTIFVTPLLAPTDRIFKFYPELIPLAPQIEVLQCSLEKPIHWMQAKTANLKGSAVVGWLWLWPKIQQKSPLPQLSTPGLPLCLIS